ncbi:MAG: hypothetical protein KAJ37_08230 [Candidatus Krumholzibacteria bacterium]|nr:hypothetical protein [Candidatus Krumholzibacteria bacterium]
MTSFRKSLRVFLLVTAVFLGGFLMSLMITSETASSPQGRSSDVEMRAIP